jgi:DNA-binding transcriptional regulator YdaS (Cro superfamily)
MRAMNINNPRDGLERAIASAGSAAALCRALGLASKSTISNWRREGRVPAEQVGPVARLTGVQPHELRPDLFLPAGAR